ncbi:MAG: hypothetical protein R3284_02920 [Rubricoccaceae bacterium]|nr:hypothetical protein [Rubricoccaceae bacterium]
MPWVLIPLAAILCWAYIEVTKHRSAGVDAQRMIEALADQLDEATEERDRLRKRVENLEAIVTSDSYELDRQAQAAELGRVDPALLEAKDPDEAAEDVRGGVRQRAD